MEAIHRLFMGAALDTSLWPEALSALADKTRSSHGQLVGFGSPGVQPFNYITGRSVEDIERFATIDDGSPSTNFRVAASLAAPAGTILSEADYDRIKPTLLDTRYVAACEEFDIPYGIQTTLHVMRGGLVGLSVLRSRSDGMSTPEDRDYFAQAVPHLRSAVQLQLTLEHHGMDLLSGSLEAMQMCGFLFNGFGKLAAMTPEAEELVASDPRFRLDRDNQFESSTLAAEAIGPNLARALRGFGGETSVSFIIARARPDQKIMKARLSRLPDADWSFGFAPRAILVVKPAETPAADLDLLRAAFGLSAAEASVAAMLLKDMSRGEIAAARGVSFATVDTQLRSIYAKVGVSREVSLHGRLRDILG